MSFGTAKGLRLPPGRTRAALAATIVAVSAPFQPPQAAAQRMPDTAHIRVTPALVDEGQHLAELNCSRCHAIARHGDSPNDQAPPFRSLAKNYPIEALDEAFAEGAFVGHSNMPQFEFTPGQIDALTAYIQSIQEPAPNSHAH